MSESEKPVERIDPFNLGYIAARKLRPQKNPYSVGTPDHKEWERGFAQGASNDEYTIDQLAEALGVNRSTIKNHMTTNGGYLPVRRKFNKPIFYRAELIAVLKSRGQF